MEPRLVLLGLAVLIAGSNSDAKILTECEATIELQRAGISRSLLSNWICLMKSESSMDTRLVTGPKTASSYSYGVFQISSAKWCSRGHAGGLCNKRCEDFASDNIQDSIVCAKMIYDREGFQAWEGWVKKCKNKPLPNIANCRLRHTRRCRDRPSQLGAEHRVDRQRKHGGMKTAQFWLTVAVATALLTPGQVHARILTKCEATHELQRAGISRTFVSNWICLMENESGMNTNLVTGPKSASSFSFGIFQINSAKWCSRGHAGGLCNKRCESYADDNIQDDIVCAKMILENEGFKAWSGWVKKCKNKPLPNIASCRR
ncbi:uncharacterized protein LOC117223691 [Megalopta genalis]|uniref:uncharacterized protein LOC117223691 n=1 Tax=Megalopta genalis TaxID=115081 RepID=UPI003FCF687E